MTYRAGKAALALLAVIGSIAGCGGDSVTPDVVVIGYERQDFDRDLYTTTAGEVTIEYVNDARDQHTLKLDGRNEVDIDVRGLGTTETVTLTLEPGEYLLYCDLPNHFESGMFAVLQVAPSPTG